MDNKAISALKILGVDMIERAKSGHPGIVLGAAPIVYELFANHLNYDPKKPKWAGRDRFVLSAGHGSALLYAALHLFGYDLPMDELKRFRQLGSKTPGHPEYGVTPGVEASTGPLGAGLAIAAGLALAAKHLGKDNYTYVLAGDGCLEEGISYEAMSLAGTLGLSKLVVLYDSNNITIEGRTSMSFTEDVSERFRAFGFHVLEVDDGADVRAIGKAIKKAKRDESRPSFIRIRTHIGAGAGAKENSEKAHGEPLGEEARGTLRENLNWQSEPFELPEDVTKHYAAIIKRHAVGSDKNSGEDSPELEFDKKEIEKVLAGVKGGEAKATRALSGEVLNALAQHFKEIIGGAADLAPSTKTLLNGENNFSAATPSGRNIRFGIREMAMAGIAYGISIYGGLLPYISTFFTFSDHAKPLLRLASLSGVRLLAIFTHDSIGVGEDGPTHQPIEQLATLRATPNMDVWRPASLLEVKYAYYSALTENHRPTALILSRQKIEKIAQEKTLDFARDGSPLQGAYIIGRESKAGIDAIIIATGSELPLAMEAKAALEKKGKSVRVVSMPCMEIFDAQPAEYRDYILPPQVRARVGVEAAAEICMTKYVGLDGAAIGINKFGKSAPANELFESFGFTAENVAKTVNEKISKNL
jgi:transketolase